MVAVTDFSLIKTDLFFLLSIACTVFQFREFVLALCKQINNIVFDAFCSISKSIILFDSEARNPFKH